MTFAGLVIMDHPEYAVGNLP